MWLEDPKKREDCKVETLVYQTWQWVEKLFGELYLKKAIGLVILFGEKYLSISGRRCLDTQPLLKGNLLWNPCGKGMEFFQPQLH